MSTLVDSMLQGAPDLTELELMRTLQALKDPYFEASQELVKLFPPMKKEWLGDWQRLPDSPDFDGFELIGFYFISGSFFRVNNVLHLTYHIRWFDFIDKPEVISAVSRTHALLGRAFGSPEIVYWYEGSNIAYENLYCNKGYQDTKAALQQEFGAPLGEIADDRLQFTKKGRGNGFGYIVQELSS